MGEDEYKESWLNCETIQRGLNLMADKYSSHLLDIVEGNEDASTSDVFLQCCLFGKVLYG